MKNKKIVMLSLFALALFSVAFLISDSTENNVALDLQNQAANVNLAEGNDLSAPVGLEVSSGQADDLSAPEDLEVSTN